MNWLFNIGLIFLVLMIVPRLLGRLRIWLLAREIQFVEPEVRVIDVHEIPEKVLAIYQLGRELIQSQLPFDYRGTIEVVHELPDAFTKISDLFVSYDGRVVASVTPGYVPSSNPFMVTFHSVVKPGADAESSQGRRLETVSGVSHLIFQGDVELADSYSDDLQIQLQTHLARIDELEPGTVVDHSACEPQTLAELEQRELLEQHLDLIGNNKIRPDSSGVFRMTSRESWRFTRQIIEGEKTCSEKKLELELEQEQAPPNIEPVSSSLEADWAEYQRLTELSSAISSRRSLTTKWVILVASGLAFFLTFGFWLGFLTSAILLIVVFVHELGHISAMALFGYRNRQVLFIPLFGAAAIGEKNEAPAWQQLVVLFMGPVPGIVIGMVCLFFALNQSNPIQFEIRQESLLDQVASLTLVLNYLNLLPLGFLDGGKIVQVLFFSKFVRARFAFQLLSALTFLALAIVAQSWIIGVIAVISVLALPSYWRFGTMLKKLESSFETKFGDDTAKEQQRLHVFRSMREPQRHEWSPRERFETAKQLIEYVEASRAGLATVVLGTFAYLISVVVPIALFILLISLRAQPV